VTVTVTVTVRKKKKAEDSGSMERQRSFQLKTQKKTTQTRTWKGWQATRTLGWEEEAAEAAQKKTKKTKKNRMKMKKTWTRCGTSKWVSPVSQPPPHKMKNGQGKDSEILGKPGDPDFNESKFLKVFRQRRREIKKRTQ